MKKWFLNFKERKGVSLIITTGILSLLAMIATSFAVNMQLEYKAAVNQLNYTKATVLAEAGIEKVIADIRNKAKTSAYNDVITSFSDDYTTGEVDLGDGSYEVTIEREDQKVNINALDETDYPWISTLAANGLSNNDIAKIIDYRDANSDVTTQILTSGSSGPQVATGNETDAKNAPYATIEELRVVLNDDTKYDAIKDIVTVSAPIIRGGLIGKYYLDRASFSKESILNLSHYKGKVVELGKIMERLMPGSDGDNWGWSESHDAEFAGAYLVVEEFGIEEFGVVWTGYIYIPENKVGSNITFYIRSNDAARLYIDGVKIIDDWQENNAIEGIPGISGSATFTYPGWHPIRIDYFDKEFENACELRWDGLGSVAHVPAEYLSYYPPSYAGPYPATTATKTTYNSAGFYRITSTGKIKTPRGDILAKKKIAAQTRVFGSWTQTTRAEFYAPWFSTYNDFSDGEILNVTWLDSCPLDATSAPATTQPNALKLGFWDDFDEDPGFTVNMLARNSDWGQFQNWYADDGNDREFRLTSVPTSGSQVSSEINAYYYYFDERTSCDLFVKVWEQDSQTPAERQAAPWDVGWVRFKYQSMFQGSSDFKGTPNTRGYYTLLKQEFAKGSYSSTSGLSELNLDTNYNGALNSQKPWTYPEVTRAKYLGATGSGSAYRARIDNSFTGADVGASESANAGTLALVTYNVDIWYEGTSTGNLTTYWDDLRIIPGKGIFISAPFCEIPEEEDGEVDWGYLSWTELPQTNQTVTLQGRGADALAGFTSDPDTWSSWGTSYSSSAGQALNLNKAKFFQYKVIMEDASHDGKTPAVTDITITYLPRTEVLYSRTEVE